MLRMPMVVVVVMVVTMMTTVAAAAAEVDQVRAVQQQSSPLFVDFVRVPFRERLPHSERGCCCGCVLYWPPRR